MLDSHGTHGCGEVGLHPGPALVVSNSASACLPSVLFCSVAGLSSTAADLVATRPISVKST